MLRVLPTRVWYAIDGFCRCISWCQSLLDLLLSSTAVFYGESTVTALHASICRNVPRTVLHGQGRETRLSGEWFLVCDGLRPYLSSAPRRDHSKEPCWPGLSTAGSVCVCWPPRCGCLVFSGLTDRFGTCLSRYGPNSWAQFEPLEMLLGSIWQRIK